jgi:hypothetical protein
MLAPRSSAFVAKEILAFDVAETGETASESAGVSSVDGLTLREYDPYAAPASSLLMLS